MTREEIEAKVRENFDAWNRHDPDGAAEIMADDCAGMDNEREIRGRDEARAFAADYMAAFSDLKIDVLSLHVDGNVAITEWRTTGTHDGELMGIPPTGRHSETRGMSIDEFGDDGKVHRSALYWNQAKLLQDLGLMPAPEGAPAAA